MKEEEKVIPANRTETGKFKKGVSGNPTGRKAIPKEVREMFEKATPDMAKLLIDTANNPDADLKIRVDCADKVLDRALGKARQSVELSNEDDQPLRIELSTPELKLAALKELIGNNETE